MYYSRKTAQEKKREWLVDAYREKSPEKMNDWVDICNVTQFRIRLLANIVNEIDSISEFPAHAKDRQDRRMNIIDKYEKELKSKKRYVSWLRGNY